MASTEETLHEANARRLLREYTAEEEGVRQLWKEAKDYAELVQLNRRFLRGELPLTVYHAGPVCHETHPLVPALLRLHEFGMLTIESQPSHNDDEPQESHCTCPGCPHPVLWKQTRQIAYITFLLPVAESRVRSAKLLEFMVELSNSDDFYMTGLVTGRRCRRGGCYSTADWNGTFPADWCTHLVKEATEEDKVADAPAVGSQFIEPGCACVLDFFKTNAGVIETVQPLIVNVLAKSWEEDDLAGKVEQAAVRVGMERVFEEGFIPESPNDGDADNTEACSQDTEASIG